MRGTAELDQQRSDGAHSSRHDADSVALGNEPPLSVDGEDSAFVDRRRVSVQWLSGTILTGLCGAALMGGAVFTSLGETNFAALPERIELALRGALGSSDRNSNARKSDRLPTANETNVARQLIRVSTMTRVGNHEVVRVRPFIRIAGNLALSGSELSANVPPFNPLRMLAESGPGDTGPGNAPATPEPDAEVAFVMRDLSSLLPRANVVARTPQDEILSRVREAATYIARPTRTNMPRTPELASLDAVTGMRLAYAADTKINDPYAGFEARIVPENVTLLPKTKDETTGGNAWTERVYILKKTDTIASVLHDFGATPDEIKAIVAAFGARSRDQLKDGQKLKILPARVPGSQRLQPIRVILASDNVVDAVVALADTGKYVPVDVSNATTEVASARDEDEDDGRGIRLYQSIYETALRNNVPRAVIDDMVRIYSYDVDFQRKAQPGDSFEVLFAGEDETPVADNRSEVLFASLTTGGETKKFYRFQSPDDSVVDYYDETGKSAKKFLVRKPIATGIMRSAFGVRRHPILGYTKMHTGVDWAAPSGTPIYAAGNGIIEKAGWESGYGKFVLLRHTNGYESAYGHMTAFARGIDEGKRVRQGQVIGFVGSTGLSTGAHVHYEIRINGRFVDPMRIKLPRGRVLEGGMLANFERERERLDGLMTRRPARVADTTPAITTARR
jgi:murein DD-endopeptidase MepM/ murein hydrolase activator NlpD